PRCGNASATTACAPFSFSLWLLPPKRAGLNLMKEQPELSTESTQCWCTCFPFPGAGLPTDCSDLRSQSSMADALLHLATSVWPFLQTKRFSLACSSLWSEQGY